MPLRFSADHGTGMNRAGAGAVVTRGDGYRVAADYWVIQAIELSSFTAATAVALRHTRYDILYQFSQSGVTMRLREEATIEAWLDTAAATCAQQGATLTPLRRHVLRLVLESRGSSTAYQLLDRLKETHKGAAPPTIYRALDFLVEQRLVHKVERLNAFVSCAEAGGHAHPVQFLICHQCGTVAEIEDRAIADALNHAAERQGFHPGRAVVELDGTCAACLQAC